MQQHLHHPANSHSDFDANDFPALSADSNRGFSMSTPGALSYAATGSLAGQAAPGGALNALQQQQQRELSAEDFPALGGGANNGPSAPTPAAASTMNGLPSSPARPMQIQQEQAAAAALAHRQGLLGSLAAGAQPNQGLRHLGLDEQQKRVRVLHSMEGG